MAATPKRLIEAQQLSGAAATYYTATNVTTRIDKMTLTNTTGGAITATVYKIKSGGSATAANTIISAKSLAAGETYNCPEMIGQVLSSLDFIQALASAGTSITISVGGVEFS